MMICNNFGEFNKKSSERIWNAIVESDPEYTRRMEEYHQKIENDFNEEWPRKHFKWFFTKLRQKKLRHQIARRYTSPKLWILNDMIEDIRSENFQQFADVKDVANGDKVYFAEENEE
jgi:hypothetical protein